MLSFIEFGKGHPRISIDKSLLVDPANAFDISNVVSVLGSQVSGMLRFYFSKGLSFLLLAFHRYNLSLGKDKPLLRYMVFRISLTRAFYSQTSHQQEDRKQIATDIKEQESRLSKAQDLLLSGQIEPDDYRDMKAVYTEKLNRLQVKLTSFSNHTESIEILLKEGLDRLFQLDRIYETGSMEVKRQVIGSMYPENLTFDGEQLRTTRINEAVRLIYTLDKGLPENEKGQNGNFSILSSQVGKTART